LQANKIESRVCDEEDDVMTDGGGTMQVGMKSMLTHIIITYHIIMNLLFFFFSMTNILYKFCFFFTFINNNVFSYTI